MLLKKIYYLCQFLRNFVKITTLWIEHFNQVIWKLSKKCGFFNINIIQHVYFFTKTLSTHQKLPNEFFWLVRGANHISINLWHHSLNEKYMYYVHNYVITQGFRKVVLLLPHCIVQNPPQSEHLKVVRHTLLKYFCKSFYEKFVHHWQLHSLSLFLKIILILSCIFSNCFW